MLVKFVWCDGAEFIELWPISSPLIAFADMVEGSLLIDHIEILSFDPSYSN